MDRNPPLDDLLAGLLGASPVARRRVARGYTPAERWIVDAPAVRPLQAVQLRQALP